MAIMKPYLLLLITVSTLFELTAQIKYTNKASVTGIITDITHAGDGSQRIFVATKSGTITILDSVFNTLGTLLDISTLVDTDSEKGLLGLAIPPIIIAAGRSRSFKIDFFPGSLSYIGNPQIIGLFIETDPPRIAQSHIPDLIQNIGI